MSEDDMLTPRMYDAVALVFELHGRDARKGTNIPYLAHLLGVCALVQQDGGDDDEGIAALLHDALEDKAHLINADAIEQRFGARVRHLVQMATDTEPDWDGTGVKREWTGRKQAYIEHLRGCGPADVRVSLADKVYNLGAILRDHGRIGDEIWLRFNANINGIFWYYSSLAAAYHQIGVTSKLLAELDALVADFAQLPGATEPFISR